MPTSQASSPHNCPGGWRRCHVAQKLCRDGKVIIPGVSVLLCLFAIPVSSSMHFLFIFPAHCYFFFLLDGNSSSAIRKSSCLQLLSFLPSVAGGVIVLSCRSLKSIFFSFSLLIYQLGSPKNTRDALEIKTLGNSLQGCVQGFGETNKRKSSLQGQGAAITPGSEDGKRSHSSWSLGRGRAGAGGSCSLWDKDTDNKCCQVLRESEEKWPLLKCPPVLRLHVSDSSGKPD